MAYDIAFAPSFIEIAGARTAYRRKGGGEPLVYLHGMGMTRRWLEVQELLADRFDVVAPEHPGFGDSERPRWFREMDDIVVHYADLLNALDLPTVHLVGHSLGAMIAGAFAALYPERIRSLTLITPGPLPLLSPPDAMAPPEGEPPPGFDVDSILFNDHQARYEEYRNADDFGMLLAADDGDAHADPSAWRLPMVSPTLYRRLARVTAPAQIIVPDEDRLIPLEYQRQWSGCLHDAPVVHVAGREVPTAHALTIQEPERVADAITALARRAQQA